ncbi:BppU family phage baseplate upper protein [Enterococcus avium]
MAYFKIVRKTLEINGSSRSTSIDLRAEVFSYDKNVSKFLFELTSKEAEIDLTGATVRVLLTYVGNDGKKGIIEDNGGVEAYTMNQIYYLLPEELRGYDGTVVMGLYVDLPSGEAIDIQNVQFRMFKSSIDDGAGVAGVVYFKSFEEWLFQVKEKALLEIQNIDDESERITEYADTKIKEYDDKFVQSNQKMSELQQSQIELSDQLNETNKKIDEADVYRKDEVFNKPESSANVIDQVIGKVSNENKVILDLKGKIVGSAVENPNDAKVTHTQTLLNPNSTDFFTLSQQAYDQQKDLDGVVLTVSNSLNGRFRQNVYSWDILTVTKKIVGDAFFEGLNADTVAKQVAILKKMVNVKTAVWGFGSNYSGNKLSLKIWAMILHGLVKLITLKLLFLNWNTTRL